MQILCLWTLSITLFLKHNVLETEFCLHLQVEHTQLIELVPISGNLHRLLSISNSKKEACYLLVWRWRQYVPPDFYQTTCSNIWEDNILCNNATIKFRCSPWATGNVYRATETVDSCYFTFIPFCPDKCCLCLCYLKQKYPDPWLGLKIKKKMWPCMYLLMI
jgi:hypothetical protein